MKFLQNILFIMVIGLITGSAYGMAPVLDLPDAGVNRTPGLQHQDQNQNVNGVRVPCKHVIVPGTPADNVFRTVVPGINRVARRNNSMAANGNIYFPRNGVQPTTAEAVQYSCANIDNRENSPITEWYMQMFGVIPIDPAAHPHVFVHAGWTNPIAPGVPAVQRIMTFHATITNANMINDPDYGGTISGENLFAQNFRKIASTSVGRTLLYRILIEIRRHIANNIGAIGNDASRPVRLPQLRNRNECRKLEIRLSDEFVFDEGGYISICNFESYDTAIGKEENGFSRIVKQRIPLDVSLFHEMNHWYHFLRDIVRFDIEYNQHRHGFNSANQAARIVQHYWNGVAGGSAAISGENWEADNGHRIDFEEIRNILGVSDVAAIAGTISGDDLSENLYRMCIGVPLRLGYSDRTYYEDNLVINRVVESCTSYREYYNCIPKALGEVDFAHGNNNNRLGLGNCRVFP